MSTDYDLKEMTKFLTTTRAGGVSQLRILFENGRVMSGVYTEVAIMARHAAWVCANENPAGVYFGLHHLGYDHIPHICAGIANKLQKRPKYAVKAQHVTYAGLLLVDVDPTRPSGVCSTDLEKAAAWKVTESVRVYLTTSGWSEPIVVDSGNGFHLYWRSSCAPGHPSWRYLLKWLARTFDTDEAKIDTSVADAARIARLPGSINAKGLDTPERPHRMCKVVNYPEAWTAPPPIYNVARAHGYTDDYDRQASYAKRQAAGEAPELLIDEDGLVKLIEEFPDYLDLHHTSHKDGRTYLYLSSCPFNGRPHRDQYAGKTAIILSAETVGFKCFSSDCDGHTFQDLLALLRRETGRKPSMPIYGPPDYTGLYELYRLWGGVDDVAKTDRRARKAKRAAGKLERKGERKAERLGERGPALQALRLRKDATIRAKRKLTQARIEAHIERGLELECEGHVTRMCMTDLEFRWEYESFDVEKSGVLAGLSTDPGDWDLTLADILPTVQRVKMEEGWKPGTWIGNLHIATVGHVLDAIHRDPSAQAVIHAFTTSMKAYRNDLGVHYHQQDVIYDTSCVSGRLLDAALAIAEGSTDLGICCRLEAELRKIGEYLGPARLWHIHRHKHRPDYHEVRSTGMDGSDEYRVMNLNELHDEGENEPVPFFDDDPDERGCIDSF